MSSTPPTVRDPITGVPVPDDWKPGMLYPSQMSSKYWPGDATVDPNTIHRQGRREYGNAHEVTGQWIQDNLPLLAKMGRKVFDVIMIKHKIDRLLWDSSRRDHYDDIIGYASLALSILENGDAEPKK